MKRCAIEHLTFTR